MEAPCEPALEVDGDLVERALKVLVSIPDFMAIVLTIQILWMKPLVCESEYNLTEIERAVHQNSTSLFRQYIHPKSWQHKDFHCGYIPDK